MAHRRKEIRMKIILPDGSVQEAEDELRAIRQDVYKRQVPCIIRTVGTQKDNTSREWEYRGKRGRSTVGKSAVQSEDVTRSELKSVSYTHRSVLKHVAEHTVLPILGHSAGTGMCFEGAMNGMASPLAVGKDVYKRQPWCCSTRTAREDRKARQHNCRI